MKKISFILCGMLIGTMVGMSPGITGCVPNRPHMKHHFKKVLHKVYHFKKSGDYAYQDNGVWWWYYMDSSSASTRAINFASSSSSVPILGGAVRGPAPTAAELEESEVETVDIAENETVAGEPLSPAEDAEITAEANDLGVGVENIGETTDSSSSGGGGDSGDSGGSAASSDSGSSGGDGG